MILRAWHEQVENAVSELPHGLRGYQILSVASRMEPTQSNLAKHLFIDKTVMPYVIDALVDEDLVERRMDPSDRRVRRIAVTAHGRAVLARLEEQVAAAEDRVFAGVSAQDRAATLELVERLAVSIHSDQPYLDPCLAIERAISESTTT
ncbi:MarR family winged helix-turn-helix transcriptional regulator [Cellulomonas fengjieae]|uniref:MarR family transcriptional regulator n=1 Tax=Cellulomonas fengjieae TaxID=2819978 RepID=A0ABS3SI03_9CELL|nr:MarR family transcriptional regulator [Cellulomonas fengjieae]MBO3085376.1 MarR family transcriptional regulator [Cellulomonas fengjieae]MBO3101121.1 MarR family transcriptional regulator [Cellulomonas fengjieae]QVI66072.1 MarR family transcriptional regulator [Cellulomonas fengjieae]